MALSPLLGSTRISFIDAAALLTGFRLDAAGRHFYPGSDVYRWVNRIVEAVQSDELPGHIENPDERTSEELEEAPRGWLEKHDLHAWLLKLGIADEEVPGPIRTYPKAGRGKPGVDPCASEQQQDKPLHARRRHTYQTLIEGLALDAMGGEIPKQPYKAAAVIQKILERYGLMLDKDPIADTIKEIQAIREGRGIGRS